MARPGVTYIEVAEAANHLLSQNKNPTIEQIRLLMGTGSSTTIANHLKQWRDEQKGTSLLAAKESIPQELIGMVKELWERMINQSEVKIKSLVTDYENTIATLREELQKYKSNNQRWQQLFQQWQQEKAELVNEKLVAEQGMAALQNELATAKSHQAVLEQQLHEKNERITELHRLHTQVQHNLEHYRESVREQRMIEQQQFEQQKLELHNKNKILKEQMRKIKDELLENRQQHQLLQQSHTTLENNYLQVESQLKNLQPQLLETEKQKIKYEQAKHHWQQQFQESQKSLESKHALIINLQAENKVLSQQLHEMKQTLNDTLEQSKLSSHEKWALMREDLV